MGREEGGGFRMGNSVYLWLIPVDILQNQYNIVKLKNKRKKRKKNSLNENLHENSYFYCLIHILYNFFLVAMFLGI